jgi:hypothetical protein
MVIDLSACHSTLCTPGELIVLAQLAARIYEGEVVQETVVSMVDFAPGAAFEAALGKLGLVDRSDPVAMAVAKLIIEFAKVGERIPSGCAAWH